MRLFRLLLRLTLLAVFIAGIITIYDRYFREPDQPANVPIVTHHTVLQEINQMGKLELVKYSFKDIVEYEKGLTNYETLNKYLSSKAEAVLIINGEAVGCVDLTKIQAEDVVTTGDTLLVYLPEPELCVYKINHDQSKVYDLTNTYFVEEGNMVNEAYTAAEKQIHQSALQMGILQQTETNAGQILRPFLEKISGKKVLLRKRMKGDFRALDR